MELDDEKRGFFWPGLGGVGVIVYFARGVGIWDIAGADGRLVAYLESVCKKITNYAVCLCRWLEGRKKSDCCKNGCGMAEVLMLDSGRRINATEVMISPLLGESPLQW